MKRNETVTNIINNKNELNKLNDMLDKLNYYISINNDEEKAEEYAEYKMQLMDLIENNKNLLNENKEEVKIYLSKIAYVIQKLANEIEMNKQLKKEADKRIKSLENSINFLKFNMIDTGRIIGLFENYESVRLGSFNARINSAASLHIKDRYLIKDEYKKETVTITIDNKKIKEALENGQAVEGAELVHNLVITGGKIKNEEADNEEN